eukprot:g16662.t1
MAPTASGGGCSRRPKSRADAAATTTTTPAGVLRSPPPLISLPLLLLLLLLLTTAPDGARSFLFANDGRRTTAVTGARAGSGGGSRGTPFRGSGSTVAIVVGGAAKTGREGAGGSGRGARAAAAGRSGRMSDTIEIRTGTKNRGGQSAAINPGAALAPCRGRSTAAGGKAASRLASMPAAAAAAGGPRERNKEEEQDGGDSLPDGHQSKGGYGGGGGGEEDESVPSAGELLVKARNLYNDKFGPPDDADVPYVCAGYAPGRVNLIGEHTDYSGGFVMPLALERGTVVYGVGRLVDADEVGATDSEGSSRGWCRVVSETMQQQLAEGGSEGEAADVRFRADSSLGPGEPEWANYVKGVVKEFMPKIPEGKCFEFSAMVVGAVPLGGGVSSSASLSVAMATFLQGILSSAGVPPPSSKEKAHLCRMAEHNFLDMPCGIMDQFVTSMAVPGHAMLLDCRSEEPDAVPLSDSSLVIVVTNSHVKHKLAGSQYPVRVEQCRTARDELQKRYPAVELLRDATPEQVEEMEGRVEDAVFRRARHVVSENGRTVAAARALKEGDFVAVGGFMLDSHRSLREDYEVSCKELDVLVDLAMEVEGVFGSRLTGGGFGGCTVTLVKKGSVGRLVEHLREGYLRSTGRDCSSFVTKPGFGARGLTGAAAAAGTAWPE